MRKMKVKEGMSKAEVYISKGCPAFIGYGKKSWFYTYDQILESDEWYFNRNTRSTEMIVRFENGVVSKIDA